MKKRNIVIVSVIGILVFLLVGVYFIYIKTDLLKSNKDLFWKYAKRNEEILDIFNSENITAYREKASKEANVTSAKLNIDSAAGIFNINFDDEITDGKNSIAELKVNKNDTSLLDAKFVEKDGIFGVAVNELLNGYVCVQNTDLKKLAERAGIEETGLVPDKINRIEIFNLLNFSNDDRAYLLEKYSNMFIANTNKNSYSKSKVSNLKINDNVFEANVYKLSLSESEFKKIVCDMSFNLSNDNKALTIISEKMKSLNVPGQYSDVENLSKFFEDVYNNINNLETSDDNFAEISTFVRDGKLLQTNIEIIGKRSFKILFDKNEGSVYISQIINSEIEDKFLPVISENLGKYLNQIEEINIINRTVDSNTIKLYGMLKLKNEQKMFLTAESTISNAFNIENDFENAKKVTLNNLKDNQLKQSYKILENAFKQFYENKKNLALN